MNIRRTMRRICLTIIVVLTAFLSACQKGTGWESRLDGIEVLVLNQPDSALTMLTQMKDEMGEVPESVCKHYDLLRLRALNKLGRQESGMDSVVMHVVDFYEQAEDQHLLPEAYFQAGRVYAQAEQNNRALLFYQMALLCDSANVTDYLRSRIFAQTGYIYLRNGMLEEASDMQQLAYQYCKNIGDTLGMRYTQEDINTINVLMDSVRIDSMNLASMRQTVRSINDKARFSMLKMRSDRSSKMADKSQGRLWWIPLVILVIAIVLWVWLRRHRKEESDMQVAQRHFFDAEVNSLLNARSREDKVLNTADWKLIEQRILLQCPNFRNALYSLFELSESEYRVCMLIKMEVAPSTMAQLLAMGKSSISQMRLRMQRKANDGKGSGKDWDNFVQSL